MNQQNGKQTGIRDGLCIVAKILKMQTEILYSLHGQSMKRMVAAFIIPRFFFVVVVVFLVVAVVLSTRKWCLIWSRKR